MITVNIIRIAAIILAGMYAVRTGYAPMEGRIEPLTVLPFLILVLCVVIFHRPPVNHDWWTYVAMVLNLLFMRHAPSGNIDYFISLASVIGWAVMGVSLALFTFGHARGVAG
jgi:energy-coupling factor transporter transmembrane protein EcfT